MRDYQPEINNPYYIQRDIYKSILYIIRSYYAQNEEYNNMLEAKAYPHITPGYIGNNHNINDPTGELAIKLEGKANIIKAINSAKAEFEKSEKEKYYLKGVWNNIIYNKPYPKDAETHTYSNHKARFIYRVGKNLNLI